MSLFKSDQYTDSVTHGSLTMPRAPGTPAHAEGAAPSTAASSRRTRAAGFFAIGAVLSILLVIGQVHRSAGAVIIPVLAGSVDASMAELAGIVSALFLAQGLSQIPVGILIDRYGPRAVIPSFALVGAVGTLVFAYATQGMTLGLGRLITGCGFSATVMGSFVLTTRWVAPERFSTMSGRFLFIGGIGSLVATTPLAFAIETIGWFATFAWLAGFTLLGAALTWLVVRDDPPGAARAHAPVATGLRPMLAEWASIFRHRRIWPILLVGLVLYAPQQILLGLWAGPFFDDVHHLGAVPRSQILFVMALGMNLGYMGFGPLERRLNRRRPIILSAMLCIAALFAFVGAHGYASAWQSALAFCVLSVIAPFFVVSISHALAFYPQQFSGRVMSTLNMTCIVGVVIVQNFTGLVMAAFPAADGGASVTGYRMVFAAMAALYVGAALLYSVTPEARPDAPRPATLQ